MTDGQRRIVGCRVDHLRLAFAVELSREALQALRHRGETAKRLGAAGIEIGPFSAKLWRSKHDDRWQWQNGRARGLIDLGAPGGWTVEIIIDGAEWLANPDVGAQLCYAASIARALGRVSEERVDKGRRLRRFDLCADFENLPIDDLTRDNFVMPKGVHSKGSLARFTPEYLESEEDRNRASPRGGGRRRRDSRDAPALVTYQSPREVTGHTVCAGNPIMGKLYAKSMELLIPQRALKREAEEQRWRARGWTGGAVTRVEFQVRSEALDEFSLRDPFDVLANLDAVWAYLTQRWVRMIDAASATRRDRCDKDSRWQDVQSVRFVGPALPIIRQRKRGGATDEQALGSVLSCLASNGELAPLAEGPLRRAMVDATPGEQATYVTSVVLDSMVTFAMRVVGRLLSSETAHDAAVELLSTKIDATWRRFNDGPRPADDELQYWHAIGDGEGGLRVTLETSRGRRSDEATAPPPAPD